jgi:hypothetical protein
LADQLANGDTILGFQTDVADFNQAKEFVKQIKESGECVTFSSITPASRATNSPPS